MIGEYIKVARKKAGLTQEELGQLIGISGVAIMRYEKGQREPSKETIEKIAIKLQVSPNELMGWGAAQEKQLAVDVADLEGFLNFLASESYLTKIVQLSDNECEFVLKKDSHEVIFSQIEFNEMMMSAKELIDVKFWKKIIPQK